MEWIPQLSIGWLNGWIPIVLLYSVFGALLLVFPRETVAALYDYDRGAPSGKERAASWLRRLTAMAGMVLMILSPLKTGQAIFLVGSAVYTLGLAGFVKALIDFNNRPSDRPAVHGLYSVSRHPQEVMLFVSVVGISLMIGSWLVLILQVLALLAGHPRRVADEQACLEQYGDAYRAYMERVPRYLLWF